MTVVLLEETARAQQMFIFGLFVSAVEVYSTAVLHKVWKGQLIFNTLVFSTLQCYDVKTIEIIFHSATGQLEVVPFQSMS